MAEESTTSEVPTSRWGLPINWDGHERKQYPFFVTSVDEIAREGWVYMRQSTNTAWVIIPQRSKYAANHVR